MQLHCLLTGRSGQPGETGGTPGAGNPQEGLRRRTVDPSPGRVGITDLFSASPTGKTLLRTPTGIRTPVLPIRSRTLYPLSYGGRTAWLKGNPLADPRLMPWATRNHLAFPGPATRLHHAFLCAVRRLPLRDRAAQPRSSYPPPDLNRYVPVQDTSTSSWRVCHSARRVCAPSALPGAS